ncbi:MAG: hypothetical protein LBK66_12525 [Spirochaetaceae bacterium]|jgi:hypothetical protein|nr:hypothetical protein [Spirochaetaceae bacterium]
MYKIHLAGRYFGALMLAAFLALSYPVFAQDAAALETAEFNHPPPPHPIAKL